MTIPPLLMIAEGRKPRLRKAQIPTQKEFILQVTIADLLRKTARPEWRWTHFPAGELRSPATGARLKRMGLRPGWPDFILLSPSATAHCLELKRIGGRLYEEQSEFKLWAARHGNPYCVAETFDQAVQILRHWQAIIEVHT